MIRSQTYLSHFTLVLTLLVLAGCSRNSPHTGNSSQTSGHNKHTYNYHIEDAAKEYGVDQKLITAIIQVESGFNPDAVSRSNAIGLMQIKADTAGCDAYRFKGKRGCPDESDLRDPQVNIDLGAAYISALQHQQLKWIENPVTRRYATEVAYANGAGTLLRTFSNDRKKAISMINNLSPEAFHWHVRKHHPFPQAPRYMLKVEAAYNEL
ncbi:transglycosylase SLT domain-containing protein [Serratia sp. DD3]|uniref:transglycosylase SLT domain-containing protein n=1 Tax=Serratia sp. DD3 TaxID=1410619 RepID=UPI0003C50232|nr:transglycosylase SLT domain-containing protein [Serratia sp. DD3]KEY57539.1 endo-type membrane-bound lytic murein transglycosylase A [Serratia sp. DD3]